MVTFGTISPSALEQNLGLVGFLALAAHSPYSLADLLVHQFLLSAGFARSPQNNRGVGVCVPVRYNHRIGCALLDDISFPVSARGLFCLASFGRISRALTAVAMIAFVAHAGRIKVAAALVALSMYPHTERFVDTQDMTLAIRSIPVVVVYLEAKALREMLKALIIYLGPRYHLSFKCWESIVHLW